MVKDKIKIKDTFFIDVREIKEDKRGTLYYLDHFRDLYFKINRVYWVTNVTKGTIRGYHAHKRNKQILICIKGAVNINLDDGLNRESVILADSTRALYLGNNVWHSIEYIEQDSVLLVLASENYEEKDYIRDYEQFIKDIRK